MKLQKRISFAVIYFKHNAKEVFLETQFALHHKFRMRFVALANCYCLFRATSSFQNNTETSERWCKFFLYTSFEKFVAKSSKTKTDQHTVSVLFR